MACLSCVPIVWHFTHHHHHHQQQQQKKNYRQMISLSLQMQPKAKPAEAAASASAAAEASARLRMRTPSSRSLLVTFWFILLQLSSSSSPTSSPSLPLVSVSAFVPCSSSTSTVGRPWKHHTSSRQEQQHHSFHNKHDRSTIEYKSMLPTRPTSHSHSQSPASASVSGSTSTSLSSAAVAMGTAAATATTLDHLVPAMAASFAGSFVQGILGFGCSLVWMSFFPLFTTIPDAVGVLQPMAVGLNMLMLFKLHGHTTPSELKPLAKTVPFGVAFGLWVVTSWSAKSINGMLGSFIILYTFLSGGRSTTTTTTTTNSNNENNNVLDTSKGSTTIINSDAKNTRIAVEDNYDKEFMTDLLKIENDPNNRSHSTAVTKKEEPPTNKDTDTKSVSAPTSTSTTAASRTTSPTTTLLAGFVGGCLTSAFGTGGPAMLVYAKEAGWENKPDMFRANLQLIFLITNVLAISSQIASGIINGVTLKATLYLLPAMVAGGLVGGKISPFLPREKFTSLVVMGLRIMGGLFIFKAVR